MELISKYDCFKLLFLSLGLMLPMLVLTIALMRRRVADRLFAGIGLMIVGVQMVATGVGLSLSVSEGIQSAQAAWQQALSAGFMYLVLTGVLVFVGCTADKRSSS